MSILTLTLQALVDDGVQFDVVMVTVFPLSWIQLYSDQSITQFLIVQIVGGVLSAPTLTTPANNATGVLPNPTFSWAANAAATTN